MCLNVLALVGGVCVRWTTDGGWLGVEPARTVLPDSYVLKVACGEAERGEFELVPAPGEGPHGYYMRHCRDVYVGAPWVGYLKGWRLLFTLGKNPAQAAFEVDKRVALRLHPVS